MNFKAVSYQQRSARWLLSKNLVENMLQPLPASAVPFLIHASFSWSPNHSSPNYLPVFELFILHLAFSPSPWFSLCSTTEDRASGLTSVTVFFPLSLAHLARLLVLRCFRHDFPYLCCCLSSLPLRWAPPSPGSQGIRQGHVKNPGDTGTMPSVCESRTGHQQQEGLV